MYTFDSNIVSDLHKEAHGFRPREGFWNYWNLSTADEKQEMWNSLMALADERLADERRAQEAAVADFEKRIADCILAGAADRNTAVRWILDAEGLTKEPDLDYVRYCLGLPYDYKLFH